MSAVRGNGKSGRKEPTVSLRCVSCDGKFEPRHPLALLYCSELCKDKATTVRYLRRVSRDGRIEDPDVIEAIRIRIALIAGGGYRQSERRLPKGVREAVIKRDGGLCQQCGEPANQIDHIDGPSSDLANLQLLCDRCHRDKTNQGIERVFPGDPGYQAAKAARAEIESRGYAKTPLRPCDDEVNWNSTFRVESGRRRLQLVEADFAERGAPRHGLQGETREKHVTAQRTDWGGFRCADGGRNFLE